MIKRIIYLDAHYFSRNLHSTADSATGNSQKLHGKTQQGTHGSSDFS